MVFKRHKFSYITSILLIYMCSNASLSVNGSLLVVTCINGKLFLPGRQYDFFKGEEGHFKHQSHSERKSETYHQDTKVLVDL